MKEFWVSVKRGFMLANRLVLKGIQFLGIILLIASVLLAPFITDLIDNPWQKWLAWFGFILLLLIFIVPLGLSPYFGMREMKRDCERERDRYKKWMWEARNEVENLKQEIAKHKQN